MSAYYNEIDPFAAECLRRLIAARQIAPGEVDTRSIVEVQPDDLAGFAQCHFFAGIGVWSYALRLAAWDDSRPVWTGSCPCQPFSILGKGAGVDDERHLWPEQFRLMDKRRPPVFFGEQVASADGLAWLDVVQSDLESANYAVGSFDLCAAGFGAPHIRQRLYFVGHARGERLEGLGRHGDDSYQPGWLDALANRPASPASGDRPTAGFWRDAEWLRCRDGKRRAVQPGSFPMAHGAAARVGRLRAYGNAIVAEVAREFIGAYMSATERQATACRSEPVYQPTACHSAGKA